jgi:hypothetical protein
VLLIFFHLDHLLVINKWLLILVFFFFFLTLDFFYDIISVLTPYYKEDVLYSDDELHKENEDGITILFYLKTIYRGEFLPIPASHFQSS